MSVNNSVYRPAAVAAFVFLTLLVGCGSLEPAGSYVPEGGQGFVTVVDTLAEDGALAALVGPYRMELEGGMTRVIGRAASTLTKASPEGVLGNMAADAMLFALEESGAAPADVAITNNGGLRVPLNEGPITVGRVFELMPFENMLVVLEMPADSLIELAHDLARAGGEPVAGMSFAIRDTEAGSGGGDGAQTPDEDGTRAVDILVGGAPVESGRTYRIATSDYLANGGGNMPTLWSDYARETPDLKLRDAFIMYIEATGTIDPQIEGRIRRE